VGRSRAEFQVPGASAAQYLFAAALAGAERRYERAPAALNQVALRTAKSLTQGTRWVVVTAYDVPGGAHVFVEAWIDAGGVGFKAEYSASPRSVVAGIPRRHFWRELSEMLGRMGLPPDGEAFRHD
jgi:hypothetical protein